MKFKRILSFLLILALSLSLVPVPAYAARKPEAVTVSVSNILSSGCIRLTWDAAENGKTYRIYRSDSKKGSYTKVKSTSSLSYTDNDAQPGEVWFYKIRTVSSNGAVSDFSQAVTATAKLPRPAVTLSSVSESGKIKISWDKVDGASSYRLYRSTNNKSWSLLKKTTSRSYTDTSAKAQTKYYYKVMAVLGSNTDGNSAYSSPRSYTCDLPRPVVTVTNDPATGRVQLNWKPISGTVNYRVYRSSSKSGSYEKIRSPKDTVFTDTSAKEGVTYYYKVMAAASDPAANSAYSTVVSGTYIAPQGLTLNVGTNEDGQAYLTWNTVKGASKYRVYRSYRENAGFKLLSTRTGLYYTNVSAPRGIDLYYYVSALDADGTVLETSETQLLYLEPDQPETFQPRYICVPSVTLYSAPETTASSTVLRYMEEVELGGPVTGSWYRVLYNDTPFYIYGTDKLTDVQSDFSYTGNTPLQQEVLDLATDIALSWNTIYATGQSTGKPNADGTYGFNAPGLVSYILNSVMEEVPFYQLSRSLDTLYRTTKLYNAGYPGEMAVTDVPMEDLQSGDVLFFGTSTKPSYCGLYLGNGEFLYATGSWKDGVCIMPLNSFRENLLAVRRYLPEFVTPADETKYVLGSYYTYNLYSRMTADSEIAATLTLYDRITVLFTNSDQWSYIRTEDGTEGYFLLKYLGDYEYLDYLTVSAALNTEGKPALTWNRVKDAGTYEVYRSLRSDRGFELMTATPHTYYTNLSAPNGLTLYYRLRALDAQGNELDVSESISVTTELAEEEILQTRYVYLPVVNLYPLPDTESQPLALRYMEELQLGLPVIEREDGTWYRVFWQNQLMYLWSRDISESLTDTGSNFSYAGNTPYQQQVIDLALEISEQWKTTYAHEQSNGVPNADGSYGFDCSGLTSYIFNRVMQPHVPTYRMYAALETQYATTAMYNAGYPGEFSAFDVAAEDLQPGDILFFTSLADGTSSTEIGHCGIYLGNNEFVHSSSSWEDAVCVMGLRGSYLENFVGARRYLPESVVPANTEGSVVGPYYNYNLYAEKNSASSVVTTLSQYDPLTILFTDNDTWAYVRTVDGHEGFLLLEHLSKYVYLDHVELNSVLNTKKKPILPGTMSNKLPAMKSTVPSGKRKAIPSCPPRKTTIIAITLSPRV